MNRLKAPTAKLIVPPPANRAGVETMMATIADLKITERHLAASLDNQIQAARDRFSPDIESNRAIMEAHLLALQAWAEAHPQEFGKLKSIETPSGRIGFRTGTPKLKTLAKWTWDRVLEKLQNAATAFVRNTPEIDKEALLASDLDAEQLAKLGVKIVQDESFYVEPKLTEVTARETVESA